MKIDNEENRAKDCLRSLVFIIEHAIYAGDWKVDGSCDPSIELYRAYRLLGFSETEALRSLNRRKAINEETKKSEAKQN